ncbi:MAG: DNA polymerase III subunit gamma/tau [Candidatus Cloacimonetes bacterium]|nr:DNA polymerase III subunit gamma/tau [Candidatus Cloacimonadota bacterium]
MSYLVLARKYRPQTFDELIAQKHITETLKNAIKTDHIAQAFLFTGPRGVGKTSMARILAKGFNCKDGPTITPCNKCKNCVEITNSTSVDVIEIDGASHTSVEDIRRLQNELMYPPQSSKYKIYIIDEVHMLSKNAFNALLKTLEEPPENVKFIFATTEPHKVIPTITSRCQRYDFHRISIQEIINQIRTIIPNEHLKFEDSAIFLIAKKADGSLRDALSLMDQILSLGKKKITKADILQVFGIVDIDFYNTLTTDIIENNDKAIIDNFHNILKEGNDINEITAGFIEYLRNILMLKIGIVLEEVPPDNIKSISELSKNFTEENLLYSITILIDAKEKLKTSTQPVLHLETTLLKLTKLKSLVQIDKLEENLQVVKEKHAVYSDSITSKPTKYQTDILEKKQLIEQKDKIKPVVKEKKASKLTFTDFKITEELLTKEWEALKEKVSKEMPVSAVHLANIKLKSINNNFLHFSTSSKLAYQTLSDIAERLSRIFTEHFGARIKVNFKLTKTESKKFIHNPTFEDIQRESPKLAKMINIIDGYIISQKRE